MKRLDATGVTGCGLYRVVSQWDVCVCGGGGMGGTALHVGNWVAPSDRGWSRTPSRDKRDKQSAVNIHATLSTGIYARVMTVTSACTSSPGTAGDVALSETPVPAPLPRPLPPPPRIPRPNLSPPLDRSVTLTPPQARPQRNPQGRLPSRPSPPTDTDRHSLPNRYHRPGEGD